MFSRNVYKYFSLFIVIFFITGALNAQSGSVKYIYAIDYPMNGKEAYVDWVKSIASILQKPSELVSIASYDNYFMESPHRVVEFEFANNMDAAEYFDDPEIKGVLENSMEYGIIDGPVVLKKRGDYNSSDGKSGQIKYVYSLDFGVGNRAAYLDRVKTIAKTLQIPKEVKRITSYENYFNGTPNRVIEFEFDTIEDAVKYFEMPQINGVIEESVNVSINHNLSVLKLRVDYKKN